VGSAEGKLFFSVPNLADLKLELAPVDAKSTVVQNPLNKSIIKDYFSRLIESGPLISFLFTGRRRNQKATEQGMKILKFHDLVDPRDHPRMDDWAAIMGPALKGYVYSAIRNLGPAAYDITDEEAVLYSEWSKSKLQWNPERRDLLRGMVHRYVRLNKNRNAVLQIVSNIMSDIDPAAGQMSPSTLSQTMGGHRAFWNDATELAMWMAFVEDVTVSPGDIVSARGVPAEQGTADCAMF